MATHRLVLYIAGRSPRAARAIINLDLVLQGLLPVHYEVEIVDVLEEPDRAGGILTTPALVREAPLPRCVVVGDLDDVTEAVCLLGVTFELAS